MASQINASNSGFGGIVSTGDSSGVLQLQAAGTTIATIQSTGLNLGSNGVVFSDSSSQTAAASPFVLKNRIINGDCRISQRNGTTATTTADDYPVDRFQIANNSAATFSAVQSTTAPAGFNNSFYFNVTAADSSVTGADRTFIRQRIEGYNIADLGFGTASAKTITLSAQVYSSVTGTFGGAILNNAEDRSFAFTYTISSANTWTPISITIAGDTTGTWLTNNGRGMNVLFSLGMGSSLTTTAGSWTAGQFYSATGCTNLISTNGATFYITGVQLERNTTATPFERRLYNQELANCQRYYWIKRGNDGTGQYQAIASGTCVNTSTPRVFLPYPVSMRAAPTVSYAGSVLVQTNSSAINVTGIPNNFNGTLGSMLEFSLTSGVTAGNGAVAYLGNLSGDYIQATAEL